MCSINTSTDSNTTSPLIRWFHRGAGDPTVTLHGFTGSTQSWEPFSRGWGRGPLGAIALPGHHREFPVHNGFDANVDQIARLIFIQCAVPVSLIGYSLGARYALGLANRYPHRVRSLVLVGVHPGLRNEQVRADRLNLDRRWIDLLRRGEIGAFVSAWEKLPLFATQKRLGHVLDAQRQIRLSHDPQSLADSLEQCGLARMPDYHRAFSGFHFPVHLVSGSLDDKFIAIARAISAQHEHVSKCEVEGVGHNVLLEAPDMLRRLAQDRC